MDPQLERRFLRWYRETFEKGPHTMYEHAALSAFRDRQKVSFGCMRHIEGCRLPPWRKEYREHVPNMGYYIYILDFPPVLLALRAGMGII